MENEQAHVRALLDAVREHLEDSVALSCECLNEHGEWEIALGHCLHHLQDAPLSDRAKALIAACRHWCL